METSMIQPFLSKILWYIRVRMCFCNMTSFWFFGRYFMEKQVMGEFVRVLKISRTITISLQLLQTISIMIQNLKSEHAICKLWNERNHSILLTNGFVISFWTIWLVCCKIADYMFSNEHINYLITYSFDFCNEELLSYYISFLRYVVAAFVTVCIL